MNGLSGDILQEGFHYDFLCVRNNPILSSFSADTSWLSWLKPRGCMWRNCKASWRYSMSLPKGFCQPFHNVSWLTYSQNSCDLAPLGWISLFWSLRILQETVFFSFPSYYNLDSLGHCTHWVNCWDVGIPSDRLWILSQFTAQLPGL